MTKSEAWTLLSDLIHNQILIIAVATWAITQILKVVVILVQEKRVAWNYFITSGGMPSSHTATVCSLATAIAMTMGTGSVYFSIAVVLAIIVMYDAAGVRQSVGQHSVVLNRIVKEFSFKATKLDREKDFREFIGHTPFQVFIGALLGIFIAWTWVILSSR
jgi:acid phosphatase family membrane protein YuiD